MASTAVPDRAHAILSYWLGADYMTPRDPGFWASPELTKIWFNGGNEVDQYVKDHFTADVEAFKAGEYDDWLQQPYSALAGIILADQFTRNIYRGTAAAFELDGKALSWAKHLQDSGLAQQLPRGPMRQFLTLPFMHSENLDDQQRCVDHAKAEYEAAAALDPESAAAKNWLFIMGFAESHRDVIAKWGRFPHRNVMLGRQSTPEEEAGLADGSIGRW
jgi:uncharacterized protein (DUF924 family)